MAEKDMEYVDYLTVSKVYDNSRTPVGLDDIRKELEESPFKDSHKLLDVGCGTGNYLIELAPHYPDLQGMDLNEGMLEAFRAKIQDKGLKNIRVMQGSAVKLPQDDSSVTAVLSTMAIHHFGGDDQIELFLGEAARVLCKGGLLIINHIQPAQLTTHWWLQFMPQCLKDKTLKHTSNERLQEMASHSFHPKEAYIVKTPVQRWEDYRDPIGITSEEGQKSSSAWSLASEEEKASAVSQIRALCEEGKFDEWFNENVQIPLNTIGNSSTVVCTRI